ncbi:MAG: hypothetical protein QM747_20695 [Nocardioides sp.]
MSSPQARRRLRSAHMALAATLLITAAVVVLGAVLSDSGTLVSVAAVLAVVLGTVAVWIVHSGLVLARREATADRARQAQGYRQLTDARTRENAEFIAAMQTRTTRAETAVGELESAVVASQARAAESARRLSASETEGSRLAVALEDSEERAAEAIVRVAELEDENGVLRTENDVLRSELDAATWQPQVKHA